MTPEQFEEVARTTRIEEKNLAAVRAVLVDGRPKKEVAEKYGLSKQQLYATVKRITKRAQEVPSGWIKIETWLPPAAVEEVRTIERREREKLEA
uniref:TrfB transcriptional repressor protein domain-containing protein n=1 Tax=Acetobacter pasteurianus TaxID=438 RepID=I3W084_ACEPA|nr:TrfB-related DNA-binding protein [Acetobacter pasteurianus]AFK89011.1 hypothetical protein [Acetobacter pasteurianus]